MRRWRSLTLRLTLLFAVGSTAVLMVLGHLVGVSVQEHFVAMDREELLGKIELVQHILSKARMNAGPAPLRERMDDALIGHPQLFVRISDAKGGKLYESQAARFPDELFPATATPGVLPQPDIATWKHDGHSFRGTTVNVATANPDLPRVIVTAAINIDHHVAFLDAFTRSLWISIAMGIMVTAILGWIAAARGLAPVREMTDVARSISASRLNDRLELEALPPELVDLASAFNGMLARLEDSFRRLSDFSSDLAHELQTPLSNVMTQTQVALSRSRTAEEYKEVLYSSLEECDRLARTVADMLFLAKADHGSMLPKVERIDVAAEVRGLFEYYDALVEDRAIHLSCGGEGEWKGDRLMIRRALNNLLSNAIAYSPRGGRVEVRIERTDKGETVVRVANRGDTIPPEHLPRLFDRFHRVDPARQRSSGGAGLGLAITQSIVHAHEGTISVSSTEGLTAFEVRMPSPGRT